jgi:hypothetical protein
LTLSRPCGQSVDPLDRTDGSFAARCASSLTPRGQPELAEILQDPSSLPIAAIASPPDSLPAATAAAPRMEVRMKSILDPTFRYTSSANTDLRKTFARIRRETRRQTQSTTTREEGDAVKKVTPIFRGQRPAA